MVSKAVKRRPYIGKVEKRPGVGAIMEDSQVQPLLESQSNENQPEKNKTGRTPGYLGRDTGGCLQWVYNLSTFVVQSVSNIAAWGISRIGVLIGKLFGWSSRNQSVKSYGELISSLTTLQEERLRKLRLRLEVPFDIVSSTHQDALLELWQLAYPDREVPSLKSDLWKEMGWQGSDPSTDFRGGGFISLQNLIYFAKNYPGAFHRILHKEDGNRAEWEYPFAIAGINISYMLVQMLDLQSGKIISKAAIRFVEVLEVDEMAFDNLYCVAFQILDRKWLAKKASYMEFNDVLKSTREQLEKELGLKGVSCIQDMPSYQMLSK